MARGSHAAEGAGGDEDADAGDVAVRKRARVGYVQQESVFAPGLTVRDVLEAALVRAKVPRRARDGCARPPDGRDFRI
jgi:ATP-binding cassette subfamily F protein uup